MSSRAVTSVHSGVCRQSAFTMIAVFLSAGLVAIFATTLAAQQPQYDQLKLSAAFEDEAVIKKMRNRLRSFATARSMDRVDDEQRKYATVYLNRYVPRRMTNLDVSGVELAEMVTDVLEALGKAEVMDAATYPVMVEELRRGMTPIAKGNHRPAARVAATMILGQLNSRPGTTNSMPVPHNRVLGTLFTLYRDQNAPDGVRAAALKGMHRHVSINGNQMADSAKQAIAREMDSLLDSTPPETRSPEAHAYLQRFAVDNLATLKGTKDKQLAQKLVSISTTKNQPDLIALYAAAKAGQMQEALNGSVDTPVSVLNQWSVRILRAVESEIERLESLDPPKPADQQPTAPVEVIAAARASSESARQGATGDDPYGAGYGTEIEGGEEEEEDPYADPYGGGYGIEMGVEEEDPQPPEIVVARRYLNHVIQQLQLAASGDAEPGIPSEPGGLLAASADQKQSVENWLSRVESIVTAVNDTSLTERADFIAALQGQMPVLIEMAGDALNEEPDLGLESDGQPVAEDAEPSDQNQDQDQDPPVVTEELVGQQ